MATPLLTATPNSPPTYNPSMAETFSWIPVEGAGRPLFAQATYIANPQDISVSLSAGDINVNLQDVEDLITQANTYLEVGTTSDNPLFVNTGSLDYTIDSVSIDGTKVDDIISGVNDGGILQTTSTALSSRFLVSGAHRVYNVFGVSTAMVNQYIQFYNSTTPTGTPICIFLVPANSNFSFDINRGLKFTNNVLIVNSLTPVTYTQGNDDLFMTVIHN